MVVGRKEWSGSKITDEGWDELFMLWLVEEGAFLAAIHAERAGAI